MIRPVIYGWVCRLSESCERLVGDIWQELDEECGIAGIGICGQMHTQVYLDAENNILRPAIT